MGISEKKISGFLGVNLLAGADKVDDREATQAQNLFQPTRGVWNQRFGSNIGSGDILLNEIPLCSRIAGIWRHYSANAERFTLYHCIPDATQFPDNTVDLQIQELANGLGNLTNQVNANTTFKFCYSWIGCGLEQTYNTRTRSGFSALSFPLHAYQNTSHQQYSLGNITSQFSVRVPVFPTGVVGANVFMSRGTGSAGTSTDMTYVGTVTTSNGVLIVSDFVGIKAANTDVMTNSGPLPVAIATNFAGSGTLALGTYYVGLAWLTDTGNQEGAGTRHSIPIQLVTQVTLSGQANCIAISGPDDNSTNGAKAAYIFIGTQSPDTHPMTFAGVVKVGNSNFFDILSIPSHNGQTCPTMASADVQNPAALYTFTVTSASATLGATYTDPNGNGFTVFATIASLTTLLCTGPLVPVPSGILTKTGGTGDGTITYGSAVSNQTTGLPVFDNQVNDGWLGGLNYDSTLLSRVNSRFGFLKCKKEGDPLAEIFPSRTLLYEALFNSAVIVFQGDTNATYTAIDIHNFSPNLRTQNDAYIGAGNGGGAPTQPFLWGNAPNDPVFCYLLGISYFSNGVDIPWQTDGYALCQLSKVKAVNNTLLPPIPRFIFTYQDGVVIAGASAGNQIYGSNSNAPQNWATGGDGTAGRYVSIGDAVGSGVSAFGIFTPQTEATSSPNSFMIAFKKNGTWMINTFPDPASSALAGLSSLVTGQVGATMIQVSGRVGCIAYRTIVQTPHGTVFLGQDGNVYLISAVAEPRKIGTKIQNSLTHLVSNETLMKLCTAVYHDNRYKLAFPSTANSTYNDQEWWLDTRTEEGPMQWEGPHVGRNIGPQVVFVGDADDLSRHAVDSNAARSFTVDNTAYLTDIGSTAIVPILRSKLHRFGSDAHQKRYLGAVLDLYIDESFKNNVLLELFADEYYSAVNRQLSNAGAIWDSSHFDQSYFGDQAWFGFDFLLSDNNLNGRTLQYRITYTGSGPFSLSSVTLLMKVEKRRITR